MLEIEKQFTYTKLRNYEKAMKLRRELAIFVILYLLNDHNYVSCSKLTKLYLGQRYKKILIPDKIAHSLSYRFSKILSICAKCEILEKYNKKMYRKVDLNLRLIEYVFSNL